MCDESIIRKRAHLGNGFEAKLLSAIDSLDLIVKDSAAKREQVIKSVQSMLDQHDEVIQNYDASLVNLPPTYEDFVLLKKGRKRGMNETFTNDKAVNHSLNFHLNKCNDVFDTNVLLLSDDFEDDLSLDQTADFSYNLENEDSIEDTSVGKGNLEDKQSREEQSKMSMRETFFSAAEEMNQDIENAQRELEKLEGNGSDVRLLTKNIERMQIKQCHKLKVMLCKYRPKLHNHKTDAIYNKRSVREVLNSIEKEILAC